MKTNMGDLHLELFNEKAPKTVQNFIELAEENFYDGIIFHRVIQDFMIQSGDPNGDGTGGESIWGYEFEDEINDDLTHKKGTLSMANKGPNTNTSQFFIVHSDETPWLDGKHTIFGQLVEGFDVLDKIATVKVDMADKPLHDIVIQKINIIN